MTQRSSVNGVPVNEDFWCGQYFFDNTSEAVIVFLDWLLALNTYGPIIWTAIIFGILIGLQCNCSTKRSEKIVPIQENQ